MTQLAAATTVVALVGRSNRMPATPEGLRPVVHGAAAAGGILWPLVAGLAVAMLVLAVAAFVLVRYGRRRRAHLLQVQAVLSEVDRALGDPLLVLQARRRLHQPRPSGER